MRNTLQNTQFQTCNPLFQRLEPILTLIVHVHNLFTITSNTTTNTSNIPTYNTIPPSTKPQSTVSHPTYINSFTSISEPIKPFDNLDYTYTPEEDLQQIEARVTFSLGHLQLTMNINFGTLEERLLYNNF